MDWYKNHFKIFAITTLTLMALTGGSFYYGQTNFTKMAQTQTIQSGIGTCFSRVTQSFTAMMIGQTTSVYLRPQFMNTTGDCFSEVNKIFKVNLANFDGASKTLNKMISDSHWFHEKLGKLKGLNSSQRNLDLSNSNIIDKYINLEQTKDELAGFLEERYAASKTIAEAATKGALAFFLVMVAVSAYYLVSRVRVLRKLEAVERRAGELRTESEVAEVERLISDALKLTDLAETRQLFLEFRSDLATISTSTPIVIAPEQNVEVATITVESNVSECFSVALAGIQNKAFTHGVIVDFDLDDSLTVLAQRESFEQLIYNVLDFSIDSSTKHNQGRKVTVRTKGLGNTALIKFTINGHCLNSSELDYFARTDLDQSEVGVNLALVKEFITDLNGEISLKNKFKTEGDLVSSEIEITIARGVDTEASVDVDDPITTPSVNEDSSRLVSVVKGKKRDLLRRMGTEA